MQKFLKNYLERLKEMFENTNLVVIEDIINILNLAAEKEKNVWIIGNGGSASTASHLSLNIGTDLHRRGIINIRAQSLTDNTAVVTAACNDVGYENSFLLQLKHLALKGDILIAISCSGNSPNIINAVEYAKSKEMKVLGISGFSGGKLDVLSDISFLVLAENHEYGLVEDIHMIFVHLLYTYYVEAFIKKQNINDFILEYKNRAFALIDAFDTDAVEDVIELFKAVNERKGRIFFIGNGGSSSLASHMVNDFGVGLKRRDILNLDIESLADNSAVLSAAGNDVGYENVFSIQLENKIKEGDVLFCLSSSGNSENILNAVDVAKKERAYVVGCTGFSGGFLKDTCDLSFHTNSKNNEYGLTHDMHMILDHMIYTYFVEEYEATK